jgi:hypothetical protein
MQSNATPYKVLPWSYSALQSYETCPRRHLITKLKKLVKEPQTAQLAWGNQVHKALELAVLGTEGLGAKFKVYQPIVDRIMASPGQVLAERDFALTSSFKTTGYWDSDAWVRGKADVTILQPTQGFLLDYKTGKVKNDPDQLDLFAAVLLAEMPLLERVRTGFLFVAANKVISKVVERAAAPIIWQSYVQRVARLERSVANDDFPPKPSGLCREYCPVGRKLCEHCGSN